MYDPTNPNIRTQILRQSVECSLDGKIWFRSIGLNSTDHECRTIVSCTPSSQGGYDPQVTSSSGSDFRCAYQDNQFHDPLTT